MSGQINNQIDLIIEQAKAFLADAGEFYPFGSVVKSDGTLTPVGAYLENDHPASIEVLEVLQKSLLQRLKQKEVVAGAICLDVLYKPAGSEVKTDALKIMTLSVEGHSRDYFVPYRNEDGQYAFGEIISEDGTLKLE
jgi:hypothetical protein